MFDFLKKIFLSFFIAISGVTVFAESVHLVKKGETLYSIGRKYQITVSELRAANNLSESDVLKAGQKLIIPNADIENAATLSSNSTKTVSSEKTESYVDDFLLEVLISFSPIISLIIGVIIIGINGGTKMSLGLALLLFTTALYIKYKRAHKTIKVDKKTTVRDLLSEVKVSHITSIPCVLEGNIIGRGNPGCIFNEDFTLKDSTGIVFLDYNQPINIINKIFALFKSKEYFDKNVTVKGWYRRSPVPYVEI